MLGQNVTVTAPYGCEKRVKLLWGLGIGRAGTDQAMHWLATELLVAGNGLHRLSNCEDLFVLVAHLNGTEG